MICLLTLDNLAGLARRYQLKLKEALLIGCSLCRRGLNQSKKKRRSYKSRAHFGHAPVNFSIAFLLFALIQNLYISFDGRCFSRLLGTCFERRYPSLSKRSLWHSSPFFVTYFAYLIEIYVD